MSDKNLSELGETTHGVLSTLTPREVAVLRRRFGIHMNDATEEEISFELLKYSSGGGGSQGGAPQNAVAPAPASSIFEENKNTPKTKARKR